MYRIDNATSVPVIPAPAAVGPHPNSFFSKGNPAGAQPATIVDDDWANAMQEEICNVIEGAGIALDKTKRNQLLAALQGKLARLRLAANTNYYVAPTGDDATGTGAIGAPWKTLQFAWNWVQIHLDLNGWTLSILAADTGGVPYAALTVAGQLVGQVTPVNITGNVATVANCVINGGVTQSFGALITLTGFTLNSTTSYNISSSGGGGVNYGWINFSGAPTTAHVHCDINGTTAEIGPTVILAGSTAWVLCDGPGSRANLVNATPQIGANVTFSLATVAARATGALIFAQGIVFSGGGVVTGKRYLAENGGGIGGTAAAAGLFPGTIAGTSATGYYY